MKNPYLIAAGVMVSLGIILFGVGPLAQSAPLHLQVSDTIAGYETTLSTTYAKPYEDISFFIQDPTGMRREFPAKSNSKGYAQATVSGGLTRIAGKYSATAVRDGQTYDDGPLFSFTVYPDNLSLADSTLTASPTSLKMGTTGSIVAHLVDKYGNPVEGKFITLVASRAADQFSPETAQTNARGEATFQVASPQEGTGTFSAIEKISGTVLNSRTSISFFSSSAAASSHWSSSLSANISGLSVDNNPVPSPTPVVAGTTASALSSGALAAPRFGEPASFKITFPDQVAVNSDQQYLTIQVLDKDQQVVKNYTKTIIIKTPDDDKSTLPGQGGKYTFVTEDQGEFTFPLALIFSKIGTQHIEVYEYDTVNQKINTALSGLKTVSVTEKTTNTNPSGSSKINITTPQQNAKFGSGDVLITGLAQANSEIKVFLDDQVNTTLSVDAKGEFRGTLTKTGDGKHTAYVMQTEGSRETSSVVSFEVDTVPPVLKDFHLYSTEAVETESQVLFSALSETGLDTAKVTVNGEDEFLKESVATPGTYELTTAAPKTQGSYDITITLTDRTGNVTSKKVDQKLEVKDKLSGTPPAPKNFKAVPIGGGAELSWDPMTDITPKVVMYIIHSGKDEQNLTRAKSVSGETNSVKIDALTPGEKRFFAVSAINTDGKEGLKTSAIAVTPAEGGPTSTPTPTEDLHPAAPEGYHFKAVSGENSAILSWDAFTGTGLKEYRVDYGVEANVYRASRKIPAGTTNKVIEDLIPGRAYFFRLSPLGNNGEVLTADYPSANATPIGKGSYVTSANPLISYPNRTTDTGPAVFLFLGALFFCGGIVFFFFRYGRRV
ncbi:MAG: Ig-like domain-containing protein [Candidatus Peregrinibacteria bacterium]